MNNSNENLDIDREDEEWGTFNAEPELITYYQIDLIESLLNHSNFDHDKREQIEREMHLYTSTEANMCIEMLKENQLDSITSGINYGQTEIKNKIKNEIN